VAGVLTPAANPAGRGTVWNPCPADIVIDLLRAGRRHRPGPNAAQTSRTHFAAVAAAAGGLPLKLGDGVRHLPSRALTQQRLNELAEVEGREHLAMNPEREFCPASIAGGLALASTLRSRGVTPRTLGVIPADLNDTTIEMARLAPDYRIASLVPMKLFVIDRKVAFFPVTPTDYDNGYLEVTQPAVVAALAALFDQHWNAVPDSRNPTMPITQFTSREQALLALLSAGHTDASAAEQMRISARSVSTILRGLMDRLGVDNRFQLGLALGALSAAPLPPTITRKENPDE
jgi:DNA-binding CsgD family transcriptional regulator